MRRRIISNEEISTFNKLREENTGRLISYRELEKLFKENFSGAQLLLKKVIKSGIIIRHKTGFYKFPEKPVHIQALQKVWDNTKIQNVSPIKEEETSLEERIEDAILFLSEHGYKVLKRSFDKEEAFKHPEKPVSTFIKWVEII